MLLAMLVAQAQDVIVTGDGDVEVTPILHGTLVLTWNDQTIYVEICVLQFLGSHAVQHVTHTPVNTVLMLFTTSSC